MVTGSSDLAKARHIWQQRNSDMMNCRDEDGTLVECASPPTLLETEQTELWPALAPTLLNPSDTEYVKRAVLMQHVWNVENPDE